MVKRKYIAIIFLLILAGTVYGAVPDDPGEVQSITDVNYSTKVYPGETFAISAMLTDVNGDGLEGQFCTLELKDVSPVESGRIMVEKIELMENCFDSEFTTIAECYFLSDSGGYIWMQTKIDWKYLPGHNYEAVLICDNNKTSAFFTVDNTGRELTTRGYSYLLFLRDNIIIIVLTIISVIVGSVLFFAFAWRR